MGRLPATLNISTNPTGYMAAASAVYAAAVMIYNAYHHHGVIDVPVIIAAATAVASLLTRQIVTPVAAPRDGAGTPLVPALAAPGPPLPPDGGSVRVIPPGGQQTG
jgi:hypothetical protein